jgi:4-oxalocrotonate tautomerase
MPHVVVKLWPGKSDEQKRRLSEVIERGVIDVLGYVEESVSIGFEEVASEDWTAKVYEPDILGQWDTLTKQPGYGARPKD